jgi:hypothetical protein
MRTGFIVMGILKWVLGLPGYTDIGAVVVDDIMFAADATEGR